MMYSTYVRYTEGAAQKNSLTNQIITSTLFQPNDDAFVQCTRRIDPNSDKASIGSLDLPRSSLRPDSKLDQIHISYGYSQDAKGVVISNQSRFGSFLRAITPQVALEANAFIIGHTMIKLKKKGRDWKLKKIHLCETPPEKVEKYTINEATTFYFGRVKRNTVLPEESIVIEDDSAISRNHCKLHYDSKYSMWVVEDLGSLNGVYVKAAKNKEMRIEWDQTIRLGLRTYMYFSTDRIGEPAHQA